jgi:non-heme chloroperoxidase
VACWPRCSPGRGLSAATVAIDPGLFRGVLSLPFSTIRAAGPFLINPLTRRRAITLSFDQFKYAWVNALDEDEAKRIYDTYHVGGSGIALMLTIDSDWREVAQTALDFVKRFV